MINRKISRIIKSVSYLMMFCMMINASVIPAIAYENKNERAAYENDIYNNGIIDGENNVIEQNGVKITVDNIKASKNRVVVSMTMQSEKEINDLVQERLEIRFSLNDGHNRSYSTSYTYEGNNIANIEEELEDENGFPEKNILRIDIVCGELDINSALKIPVDFTESFKRNYTKEINYKLNDQEVIEKLESNDICTCILISKKYDDYGIYDKEKFLFKNFIAKVDEKYYTTSFPQYVYSEGEKEFNAYELKGLSYDDVKNAENISIITFENTMNDDEIDMFYKNDDCMLYCEQMEEITNISYPENVKFNDGTTGSIQVKREDGKIQIGIKGNSDKHSIIMFSSLNAIYADDEDYYGRAEEINAYKIEDGYVAEFRDTAQNRKLNISMDGMIYNIDKYIECDEIKVK